jgi:NNP family nitrate/nitrite transporter-like MFS transporter
MLLMAIGMGICNAAVFKLMPMYVPRAVGGAAGWIGGLGAFGGFAIPPLMGVMVSDFGKNGYPAGFWVFAGLALVSIGLAMVLQRSQRVAKPILAE